MTGWPQLDRFLRTDPRDAGCTEAMDLLHVCAELAAAGEPVEQRFPGVIAHLSPSRPGDPKVNHARSLQMSDFPTPGEQRWLIAEAGPAFPCRADRKHRGDEGIPPRVAPARVHTVIVDTDHRNAAHNFAHPPLQALGQELRGEDRPPRCALPGPAQITRRTVSEPSTICLVLIG